MGSIGSESLLCPLQGCERLITVPACSSADGTDRLAAVNDHGVADDEGGGV